MKKFATVIIAAGIALLASAVDSSGAIAKDEKVTLVVPLTAFESEFNIWTGTKYVTSIDLDENGGLILNRDDDWRLKALPTVLTGTVSKVKKMKKERLTRVVISAKPLGEGSFETFIFEIPDRVAGWDRAMDEIAITQDSSAASTEEEINERVLGYYDLHCPLAFTGNLASLPHERQIALMSAIHAAAKRCSISTESFKGETYLAVNLGQGHVVYNTNQVNQNQRLARDITDRVFPVLKAAAAEVTPDDSFGLQFMLGVRFRDFTKENASTSIDVVSVYTSLSNATNFANYEITDQELIDDSFVIADDNRVKVSLTEQ